MMSQYQELLDFAQQLADEARGITLPYFRQTLGIEKKQDGSPVTIADKRTEEYLRRLIEENYPEHGIIGEEQEEKQAYSEFEWIIDPIDGTKSFLSGYPLYGTLIALLKNGEPVVSVIDMPALDERFFACKDLPTHCVKSGLLKPVNTKLNKQLSQSICYSTDYTMFSKAEHQQLADLRQSVSMLRYNGDCYLYAMLASGWIDLVVEADLKVYDFLPLCLIVEQAGGVITDWQGNKLDKQSIGQVIAASNRDLHRAALEKIG